jgi:hypothetical protein
MILYHRLRENAREIFKNFAGISRIKFGVVIFLFM